MRGALGTREGLAVSTIVEIFDRCFADERTVLRGGFDEPLYLPWRDDLPAEIRFRADYRASALHEVAHWCIAGRRRRELEDYGYWYAPDGRDAAGQAEFERVEAAPQALEWFLHLACGSCFHLSFDNLAAGGGDAVAFERAVRCRARTYRERGLPARARRLVAALAGAWPSGAEALAEFEP